MPKKSRASGLRDIIISKYSGLSRQEKKIADFIIRSQSAILVFTGKELSTQTGVSEATTVRFAQHLGFRGFQQMRSQMIEEFKELTLPQDRFKLVSRGKNPVSTINRVAELEVQNINDTIKQMDPQQLREFINRLRMSRYVYIIGLGISSVMAKLAAYLFNQAGILAFACQKEEHSFIERLINLDRKDAVLALSYPLYSKETIDALKFCFQRDVSCLAITDKPTAPAVQWTHAHLIVRSDNLFFTNAAASMAMMLNALSTELAFFNKDKVTDNSNRIFEAAKNGFIL